MAVAVAAAVSGVIGTAVTVVKWIGAPIKRQFTYLCCFSSNITNLRNEAQQLELKAGDLQGKVDRARDDVRVISGEVENWLKEYGDIMSETGGILNEVPSVESGCLKLGARFSLSKRAKNTTDRLKELRDQCKFEADVVSQPGPPAAMKTVPLPATYHEFNSRKQIEEDIVTTLRGGDVNIMGICGWDMWDMFEGNVEDARDWMYSLTKRLKNRSLLLDRNRKKDGDAYVRMHDVVRDFCKFIAKQEGHDCTWISVSQRFELPTTFTFPNLRLLFLICKRGNEEFRLDNNFLEGIKDLYVLSIEGISLTSLPHTTQSLKNLKTLVLDQCWELETLSGVGELVNLEILICRGCRSIEELPLEMKELNRLKLLDLSRCGKLQRIGGGIISSLVALEELKMLRSFYKWEEGENASFREVEELKMLRWLEIEIEDPAALAAAEKMHLPSKLDRFHIRLSRSEYSPAFTDFWCNKKLELLESRQGIKQEGTKSGPPLQIQIQEIFFSFLLLHIQTPQTMHFDTNLTWYQSGR